MLSDREDTLLRAIITAERRDVAQLYGVAIRSAERSGINWGLVNKAIVARWSMSALEWIKKEAWRR